MRWLKIILVLIFLSVPGYFIQSWYGQVEIRPTTEFILIVLTAKAAGTVYPPLPGIILTLALIPIFGWARAYLLEIIGSFLGMTAAYWLGHRYGERIIKFVVGDKLTVKIKKIKLKPGNQIEAAFVLRTASGGVLSDALAWGASLIGLRYWPYVIAHLANHLCSTLPIFLFLGLSIQLHSWLIAVPVMILAWLIIWRFKGRYFE